MPTSPSSTTFRVGLVLQTGQAHMRGVVRGVFQFVQDNDHWQIVGEGEYPLLHWKQLPDWEGDGLIAIANNRLQLRALLDKDVPVVNAGLRFVEPQLFNVACDSMEIGRVAAEHLLNCGLRKLMFVGELKWDDEQLRHEAFVARIERAGHRCETLRIKVHEYTSPDAAARYHPDLDQLAEGLRQVEKPVGVCTPNSEMARFISKTAQRCGFRVPDDVAVLGVNDDPIICESTKPHLSAVVQPSEQIGLEAARHLDRLMRGESLETRMLLLPPMGVIARRSTDVMAIEDEDVRSAMAFIRDHAHEPIEVGHIAEHVAVSRRTLETKFKRILGRTPSLELRRARIDRAKLLLVESEQSVTAIAYATGFNSRQVFSTLFHKETGMTARAYRLRFHRHLLG